MTLDAGTVADYLVARGVVPKAPSSPSRSSTGGVSGTVLAVRGPGSPWSSSRRCRGCSLRMSGLAPARRTDTEAAALRLAARLIPGHVPPVVDSDGTRHVLVMQHAPAGWRNWQAEMLAGRVHADDRQLGRRHARAAAHGDGRRRGGRGRIRRLRGLRATPLEPYYGTVMERIPQLAPGSSRSSPSCARRASASCTATTRPRTCSSGRDGAWLLDAEVAHVGHPVFDLAFFLAFPLLTALQKPALARGLQPARRALHDGVSPARAGALPPPAALRRPHGRDAARAHRRQVAGDVPRVAPQETGASAR